jgi:glucose/arabinose dehydrogenase
VDVVRAHLLLLWAIGCGGGHAAGDGASTEPGHDGAHGDVSSMCPDPDGTFAVHAQQIVGTGLVQPVFVTQAPGNDSDLYVLEKPGRIRIVRAGAVVATPFLDVTASVNIPGTDAEGGLLGLAFASDYATSGRFFVYLTLLGPNRAAVVEFHRSANPDVADPTPMELFQYPQDGFNSIGGTILFGPDHYLWLGTGDAERTPSASPDVTSRLGKMLRIDVDNPTVAPPNGLGGTADPYVWDYGLRNPYRFSFDRATGDLYIADSGDAKFEEVDIEPPGMGHRDYGWDRMEGTHCHDGSSSCGSPGTLPAYEQPHDTSFSVIIGGSLYRGSAIPAMRCRYLFAVFGVGRIMSLVWDGQATGHVRELSDMFGDVNLLSVTSIAEDNAGELYVTTIDGKLYKIVPN